MTSHRGRAPYALVARLRRVVKAKAFPSLPRALLSSPAASWAQDTSGTTHTESFSRNIDVSACVRVVDVWDPPQTVDVNTAWRKKLVVRDAQPQLNPLSALLACRDVLPKVECRFKTETPCRACVSAQSPIISKCLSPSRVRYDCLAMRQSVIQ